MRWLNKILLRKNFRKLVIFLYVSVLIVGTLLCIDGVQKLIRNKNSSPDGRIVPAKVIETDISGWSDDEITDFMLNGRE